MKSDNKINIILTNESFEKGFSKLNKDGIKLSHFPMIKTKPVEQEINLFDIDCVIFTSKNGVKYFFKNKQIIDRVWHKLCVQEELFKVYGRRN